MDTKNLKRWLAVGAGGDMVRLVPIQGTGPDVFVKLLDAEAAVAAAFEAGKLAQQNRCSYPDCVQNEDERCARRLSGDCESPIPIQPTPSSTAMSPPDVTSST